MILNFDKHSKHISEYFSLPNDVQKKTDKKLFCRCPAGLYQKPDDYDAELLRHMRPTLSELGEYDGTALMEFRTRKNITYRIKNETTCTYDVDYTPPFPINLEAIDYAVQIARQLKLNIVGDGRTCSI